MGLVDLQMKFSIELAKLIIMMDGDGIGVRFGDVWRSTDPLNLPESSRKMSYQELLLFNGKTKVKYGAHNDRIAADLILMQNGTLVTEEGYRKYGEYWEKQGGIWGGRFGVKKEDYATKIGWDANHFEWRR